jgi:hypothetical protein
LRVVQPVGTKGSLKWIQKAVNTYPDKLCLPSQARVDWLSPKYEDQYAEYRDESFLSLLGLDSLANELNNFWPGMGPQWDALGREKDKVWLVEAKAHIGEFLTPGTKASPNSRTVINSALDKTKLAMGAADISSWADVYYQYTNRLAHLHFLRSHSVNAHLLFVSFLNDHEMGGPSDEALWLTVFKSADYALGIPAKHPYSQYVHHVYPDVSTLA